MVRHGNEIASAVATVLVAWLATFAQTAAAGPEQSVTYIEQQLRPNAGPGRKLHTERGAVFGVDINSSVKIDIDEKPFEAAVVAQLQNVAQTEKDRVLVRQFTALRDAAARIQPTMQGVESMFAAWATAERTQDYANVRALISSASNSVLNLLDGLQSAIEQRLVAAGLSRASAHAQAQSDVATVLTDGLVLGYNWQQLTMLYAREITEAEGALAASAKDKGLGLSIRAGLITAPNQATPIFLPGYNQVATGTSTVYQKVTYSISPEKKDQFDAFQEAAAKLGEANSLGDAVLKQLRADLATHDDQIRVLLSGVAASARGLKDAIEGLDRWRAAATRQTWFARSRTRLQATPAGQALIADWSAADKALDQIDATLAAVTALAQVPDSVRATTNPVDALSLVQSTFARLPHAAGDDATPQGVLDVAFWTKQIEALSAFADGVAALGNDARAELTATDGPLGAINKVRDAGKDLVDKIKAVPTAARAAVIRTLAQDPIQFAANLPVPDGAKIVAFGASTSLDTSFDLKTIAGGRQPDEEVRVEFHFFRGEEELTPLTWSDTFHIRVFGWQDHVAAGIAFVEQESASTWKPTATLSWLLKKSRWPADGTGLDFGTPEWYSGFGLSTLPLDFDEKQDVEVGIALTASFLNDRILIGYGSNLNVSDNNKFWFISFRIFQNDGLINGKVGK
jgi:hypothetical protein